MPLYRTAHSPENSSDEWAFFFPCIKFTFVVTQIAIKSVVKTIIFHLSQSKCTVSALFLHTGGKAVFFLALSAFCASWQNLSGQSPSILLAQDRSVA